MSVPAVAQNGYQDISIFSLPNHTFMRWSMPFQNAIFEDEDYYLYDGESYMLRRIRLSDYKTDIFLAANVMDSFLTYVALQYSTQLAEFNSIMYGIMNTIGIGPALFLKIVLCLGVLWILRKTRKEKLLVPLSVILVVVALVNLTVIRAQGIEV